MVFMPVSSGLFDFAGEKGIPFSGSKGYYLNLAPTIYCGLKRLVFKTRFMILILTI
jgi:hypothetical protein